MKMMRISRNGFGPAHNNNRTPNDETFTCMKLCIVYIMHTIFAYQSTVKVPVKSCFAVAFYLIPRHKLIAYIIW